MGLLFCFVVLNHLNLALRKYCSDLGGRSVEVGGAET